MSTSIRSSVARMLGGTALAVAVLGASVVPALAAGPTTKAEKAIAVLEQVINQAEARGNTKQVQALTNVVIALESGDTGGEEPPADTLQQYAFDFGAGHFQRPAWVEAGTNLVITDEGRQSVDWFTPAGELVRSVSMAGLGSPNGVALDASGNAYVALASRGDGQGGSTGSSIVKLDADGNLLARFGQDLMSIVPTGIAVDAQNRVLVADNNVSKLHLFDTDGAYLQSWAMHRPYDVDVAGANIYVLDLDGYVNRYDASGALMGSWLAGGQAVNVSALTHDARGNLYVSAVKTVMDEMTGDVITNEHYVAKFTAAGSSLGTIGSFGLEAGQFTWPGGLAMHTDGTLYVADMGNQRVQAFR